MNKHEILKKIGIIINELQDQYDYTEQNNENMNDLELELFVANAHFLTDHIEILRKLNGQQVKLLTEEKPAPVPQPTPEEKPKTEAKYFEPVVQPSQTEKKDTPINLTEPEVSEPIVAEPEPKVEEVTDEEPVPEIVEVNKEEATPETVEAEKTEPVPEPIIRHELLLDEQNSKEEDKTDSNEEAWHNEELTDEEFKLQKTKPADEPIAPIIPEPTVVKPKAEVIKTQIIIEDPETDKPLLTINQMISAQIASSSRLNDHSELQPIQDLKSAINLNDKLLFVRDLFNGYSMAYGEAVEILNRFNKFEEADQFLKLNYYTKNNWEAKQATTDKFYEILHRRFTA